MQATAYATPLIKPNDNVNKIIAEAIPSLDEGSVVAVASKIISTAESRLVKKKDGSRAEKYQLVREQADYYLEPHSSKYGLMLTIKDNYLFMFAGVDESNIEGENYLLWPSDPYQAATDLWQYLRQHFNISKLGVILTDSTSQPLNWGVTGHALAYCGFDPLYSYVGKQDLYGRDFKFEKLNVMQCIASTAVLEMGEGNEQTPIAVITQANKIVFQDQPPTAAQRAALKISIEDDAYAPLMTAVDWQSNQPGNITPATSLAYSQKVHQSLANNSQLMFTAAQELGLKPQHETEYGVFSVQQHGSVQYFFHTHSPKNSAIAVYKAKNKQLCRISLSEAGFKEVQIPYLLPTDHSQLESFLTKYAQLVAKPLTGSKSYAVHLVSSISDAQQHDVTKWMYEEYVAGDEYRFLVLDGEVIAVQRKKFESGSLQIDTRDMISKSDLDPAITSLAVSIAETIGLHWAAVDLILSDHGWKLLEVNANPGLLRMGQDQDERLAIAQKVMASFVS